MVFIYHFCLHKLKVIAFDFSTESLFLKYLSYNTPGCADKLNTALSFFVRDMIYKLNSHKLCYLAGFCSCNTLRENLFWDRIDMILWFFFNKTSQIDFPTLNVSFNLTIKNQNSWWRLFVLDLTYVIKLWTSQISYAKFRVSLQ